MWPLEMIPIRVLYCSVWNVAGRSLQPLQAPRFCSKAAELLQGEGDGWLVPALPVFLKQGINVKSSFKNLLPQLHENIGDKLPGTQRSVGQSKPKPLYN